MIENKQVMAKNILYYMSVNNVTATDVCKACGFKQNTFSDWVNAKTYPRIDKIELMANYFHVNKACLVEERKPDDTFDAYLIRQIYAQLPPDVLENGETLSEAIEIIKDYEDLPPEKKAQFLTYLKFLRSDF